MPDELNLNDWTELRYTPEQEMMVRAKNIVGAYVDTHWPVKVDLPSYNIYIVWFSKTLKNWKALLITTLPDQIYYELTHNGETDETYVDVYSKIDNVVVPGTRES